MIRYRFPLGAQVGLGIAGLCVSIGLASGQQQSPVDQKPPVELPNSISGSETVRVRMDKFVREQGLRAIKDNKKDEAGRTVLIDFATATIAAPPADPNFVNARIAAFNKAMLNAKAQCAEFQRTLVSTEAVSEVTQPPAERARSDAERLKREGLAQEGATKVAQALNSDLKGKDLPQALQTAAVYGEKLLSNKMAEELRKKGLDPTKPVDQQVAKAVAESAAFKNAVSTVAAARCTGIKALASFEQNPASGQGQVGIVTVWSEKLHAIADAIVTNQWDLVPKGEPGVPIGEQIPRELRTLLTTYGAQLVRDEKGEYVLLAYAQAQPRTKNQQSIDTAYEVAKTRGMGLVRSYMGESVETSRELFDQENSIDHTDETTRYEENSSFARKASAVGQQLPISGVTVAHEWETLHPANNGPIVGVVMQWKVASAQIAATLARLNQASGAKAAAVAAGTSPPPQERCPATDSTAAVARARRSTHRAAQGRSVQRPGQGSPGLLGRTVMAGGRCWVSLVLAGSLMNCAHAQVTDALLERLRRETVVTDSGYIYAVAAGGLRGTPETGQQLLETRAMRRITVALCAYEPSPGQQLDAAVTGFQRVSTIVRGNEGEVVMRAPLQKPDCRAVTIPRALPSVTPAPAMSEPPPGSAGGRASGTGIESPPPVTTPGVGPSKDVTVRTYPGDY